MSKYLHFLMPMLLVIYFMSVVSAQRRYTPRDYGPVVPETRKKPNVTRVKVTTEEPSIYTNSPLRYPNDDRRVNNQGYPNYDRGVINQDYPNYDRRVINQEYPNGDRRLNNQGTLDRIRTPAPPQRRTSPKTENGRRGGGGVIFPGPENVPSTRDGERNVPNKQKKKNKNKNKNKLKGRDETRFWPSDTFEEQTE